MTTITRDRVESVVFSALEEFGAEPESISLDAQFEALDVDSLDMVELSQIAKEEFGVEIAQANMPELKTVGDAVALIATRAGV
jgi:acyl carrier protein